MGSKSAAMLTYEEFFYKNLDMWIDRSPFPQKAWLKLKLGQPLSFQKVWNVIRLIRRYMINTRLVNHLTNLDITPRLDFLKFKLKFSGLQRWVRVWTFKSTDFFYLIKTTGSGDPTTSCRPECSQLSDCPFNRQCQEARCVDPCLINIETGYLGSNLHDIHTQN